MATLSADELDDELRKLGERKGFVIWKPWEYHPADVAGPCPGKPGDIGWEFWHKARRLRDEWIAEIETTPPPRRPGARRSRPPP